MALVHYFHWGALVKFVLMTMMLPARKSVMFQSPTGNDTRHDIHFGKYFKAVNQFGKQVLHIVFIVIYSSLETSDGNLSVEDYCRQTLKWTNTLYRSTFTSLERDILKNNPKSANFSCDITLLFKLISRVLGKLADTFIKEIRDLKNLRNTVCHEDIEMDRADLKSRVEALETLCHNILERLGSVTGEDVSSFLQEIQDGLNNLLDANIESSDIQTYLEDVNSFREQKHSKFITEGRRELVNVYSKVKILNPCSWLSDNRFSEFTVDRIFTSLVVSSDEKIIVMNEILNVKAIKTRFVARLVIVSGVMGAGKTSLYRYILDDWSKRSPSITGLLSTDIVIGIELRSVSCGSLVQYLREQLLISTSRHFNDTDIIPLLQEMNVLFAIDGMDEANKHGKMLVREIVTKFTNSRIIITTRPAFMLELMKMAEDHVVLKINGFDEQGKIQFINNFFAAKYGDERCRESEMQKFLKYMSSTCENISSHLSLPLTLALLLVLWCDETTNVTSITTLTRLYHKIYDMCQKKLASRLEAAGAGHPASILNKVHHCLLELGRTAWTMIHNHELQITEEQTKYLMKMCENEGIDPIQTMSAFMNCEVKENVLGSNYYFAFHHNSGITFLAALHVSDLVTRNQSIAEIFSAIDSPRYREFVMYITGLLKINGNLSRTLANQITNSFVDMGVNKSDASTWWKLLQEAEKDSSMAMALGSIINQSEVWTVYSQNRGDKIEAKLNLLRTTGASPSELIMEVHYTKSLSCCEDLKEILNLVCKGNSRVKLYLEKEFNSVGNEELNDEQVVPLLKSNQMVEFKGHAGEDFMNELVNSTKIQSLFVRVSTVKALQGLQTSIKKNTHWMIKFLASNWALKFIELFLDLGNDISPKDIPSLHYEQTFVVKMANVTDNNAKWAGKVLKNLNHQYSSIIFQASSVTADGMRDLLEAISVNKPGNIFHKIEAIRVLSDYSPTAEDNEAIAKKYKVRIGWGDA